MSDNNSRFCFVNLPQAERDWLMYQALPGRSPASQFVEPPAGGNVDDLSTLPGGVAPTSGLYIAVDNLNIYTIQAGDTQWYVTPR